MNYGFIGAGNMAGAIIKGMTIGTGSFEGKDIYVYDLFPEAAENLSKTCGVNKCDSSADVVAASDVLVLAVKPNVLEDAVKPIKEQLIAKAPLIISIAAGKTVEFLENLISPKLPIVRVMPNINAKVGCATSAFCPNAAVADEQKEVVKNLFSTVGSITELPEKMFGIHGVIGGAAPAFAYLYIDALARAAVKAGMPKKQALELTAQTVLGSAKMVLETGKHPGELKDMVCSPAGTTIEAVRVLEEKGLRSAVIEAMKACAEVSRNL